MYCCVYCMTVCECVSLCECCLFRSATVKHISGILIYKSQQDAHVTQFILSDNCSTCFGRHYTHLQEHKTTITTASGNRYAIIELNLLIKSTYRLD